MIVAVAKIVGTFVGVCVALFVGVAVAVTVTEGAEVGVAFGWSAFATAFFRFTRPPETILPLNDAIGSTVPRRMLFT